MQIFLAVALAQMCMQTAHLHTRLLRLAKVGAARHRQRSLAGSLTSLCDELIGCKLSSTTPTHPARHKLAWLVQVLARYDESCQVVRQKQDEAEQLAEGHKPEPEVSLSMRQERVLVHRQANANHKLACVRHGMRCVAF